MERFKPGDIVVPISSIHKSYGVVLNGLEKLEVLHDVSVGSLTHELIERVAAKWGTKANVRRAPPNGVLCKVIEGNTTSSGTFAIGGNSYIHYSRNPTIIAKGSVIWLSRHALRRVHTSNLRTEATKNKNAAAQLTTSSSSTRRILALRRSRL